MAVYQVVVNESGGLQECVADGGSKEAEAPFVHVFADAVGQLRIGRHFL